MEYTAYEQAYYDAVARGDIEFNYNDYNLANMDVAPPVGWMMNHGWGSSPLKDENGTEVGQGPDGYVFPIVLIPWLLQDPTNWKAAMAYEQKGITAYRVPRYGKLFIWGIDELPPEGYLTPGWVSYTTMSFPGKPGKTFLNTSEEKASTEFPVERRVGAVDRRVQ